MNPVFSELTQEERAAVIAIGCAIWASPNKGRLNLADPEVISYAKEFLYTDGDGDVNIYELRDMLQMGCAMDQSFCYDIVSGFDQRKQARLRVLFGNLAGDNAFRALFVSQVMQRCGFGRPQGWETTPPRQENYGLEEDEAPITEIDSKPFVRLCAVSHVREIPGKIQHIQVEGENETRLLPVEFQAWREKGICPANGLVGIICEKVETEEGTLCVVVFSNIACIGVLEDGLEHIEEYQYISKQVNNRILSYDRNGERMQKLLRGEYEEPLAEKKSTKKGDKTIRYYATKQDRLEYGRMVCPTSYVQRTILLEYTHMGREVTITVMGVMQPKHARIVDDDGVVLKYVDTYNPGYTYEIETNPRTNEIERISIFVSYTGVEYRYTN